MGHSRWDPNQDLMRLQDRMSRVFGRTGFEQEDELISGNWTPLCDIIETADAVLLRADMPGMKQENIDINVAENVLTVKGERAFEKREGEAEYHRIERSYGTFSRSFSLPRNVSPEKITADYRDGVLEVRMPKRTESLPRQIKVNIGTK